MAALLYTSCLRVQGETKINCVPSGDQAGWQAPSVILVICTGFASPVPCRASVTFNKKIWGRPFRLLAKAIWPSPPPTGVAAGVSVAGITVGANVSVGAAVSLGA